MIIKAKTASEKNTVKELNKKSDKDIINKTKKADIKRSISTHHGSWSGYA